jgi:hypothetical protein
MNVAKARIKREGVSPSGKKAAPAKKDTSL